MQVWPCGHSCPVFTLAFWRKRASEVKSTPGARCMRGRVGLWEAPCAQSRGPGAAPEGRPSRSLHLSTVAAPGRRRSFLPFPPLAFNSPFLPKAQASLPRGSPLFPAPVSFCRSQQDSHLVNGSARSLWCFVSVSFPPLNEHERECVLAQAACGKAGVGAEGNVECSSFLPTENFCLLICANRGPAPPAAVFCLPQAF